MLSQQAKNIFDQPTSRVDSTTLEQTDQWSYTLPKRNLGIRCETVNLIDIIASHWGSTRVPWKQLQKRRPYANAETHEQMNSLFSRTSANMSHLSPYLLLFFGTKRPVSGPC